MAMGLYLGILPRLLAATGSTVIAAWLGSAIAVLLGLVLALAQSTPYRALSKIVLRHWSYRSSSSSMWDHNSG